MYKKLILTLIFTVFLLINSTTSKCFAGIDDDLGIYKIKLDYYDNQIKQHPRDIQNYLAKADICLELNKLPEARELYKQAYEISGSISMKKYLEAMILFTEYKTEEALEKIDLLLKEEPTNPNALYLKGVIDLQSNDQNKALEDFQKVLDSDSNNIDAMNKIGWIYVDKADYDKALYYFNQILFRDRSYVNALDGKGYALFKIGLFKEAIPYLNEAIILLPESWGAWATRGQIYLAMDKYNFADYCLKKAEAINPEAMEVKLLREKLYPALPLKAKNKEESSNEAAISDKKPCDKVKNTGKKMSSDKAKKPCEKMKKPCDKTKKPCEKMNKPCEKAKAPTSQQAEEKQNNQKQFQDAIDE